MIKFLAAAAVLLSPVAAMAQTTPKPAPAAVPAIDATVYDKAFASGWQNWSWAKTEVSSPDGGARLPIKVEAKGWEAVYLHHDAFSTTPFRGVSMLLQPVGGAGKVRVVAIVGGKAVPDPANPSQPLGHVVDIAPGGWKQVQVSLKDLGVEKSTIDGFWIQNATADPSPTFFVAEVKLMQ